MTTDAVTSEIEAEDEETTPDPEAAATANKQLRDHLKAVEKENASMRGKLIGTYLGDLGLNAEVGLGKAIAKEYKGEMSAEAIAEYAKTEYGHEVAEATTTTPEPVAQTSRIDALNQGSQSITPPPAVDPVQEAAARMHDPNATREEAASSLAAKVGQFVETHYGPQGPQAPSNQ